ncbi:MAG: hypothetical protein GC162_16265 [Planctomycetes bacterium]|nr:hypothetical protein [Planctomycetota bacterium]
MRSELTPPAARLRRHIRTLAAISIIALIGGCQTAHVDSSLTATLGGNDPAVAMDFWHSLEEREVTSYDDAFHALLLFTDGEDPAGDYDKRVATLKERGWLDGSFSEPGNEAAQRGDIAVVVVRALQIDGGLTMRVLGATPRYAVRELQVKGLYPQSSPFQAFSGSQYVALIGRIDDFVRDKRPGLFKVAEVDPNELADRPVSALAQAKEAR